MIQITNVQSWHSCRKKKIKLGVIGMCQGRIPDWKNIFRQAFLKLELKKMRAQVIMLFERRVLQAEGAANWTIDWSMPGVFKEHGEDQCAWRNRSEEESTKDEVRGMRSKYRMWMGPKDQEKPWRVWIEERASSSDTFNRISLWLPFSELSEGSKIQIKKAS